MVVLTHRCWFAGEWDPGPANHCILVGGLFGSSSTHSRHGNSYRKETRTHIFRRFARYETLYCVLYIIVSSIFFFLEVISSLLQSYKNSTMNTLTPNLSIVNILSCLLYHCLSFNMDMEICFSFYFNIYFLRIEIVPDIILCSCQSHTFNIDTIILSNLLSTFQFYQLT